jgi:RimJ/RimL family protein N-acetyltransferase
MPEHRPASPLTDGTLLLRPFVLDDVPAVTEACQDPEIARWTSAIPSPYTEEDARRWIASHPERWASGLGASFALIDPAEGALVGTVGLQHVTREHRDAEIGYWVAAWARGHGVATRAVALATRWAFSSFDLDALDLLTMLGNTSSERVADKAGYHFVAVVRNVPGVVDPTERFDAKRWARTIRGRAVREWPEELDRPG